MTEINLFSWICKIHILTSRCQGSNLLPLERTGISVCSFPALLILLRQDREAEIQLGMSYGCAFCLNDPCRCLSKQTHLNRSLVSVVSLGCPSVVSGDHRQFSKIKGPVEPLKASVFSEPTLQHILIFNFDFFFCAQSHSLNGTEQGQGQPSPKLSEHASDWDLFTYP